ncbi:DUF4258 domain-containing protein [Bizionia paragorgiae]|uniref:DUF4258 domain-containing protein n=1 Tax=Bizionia paragorgiae TaxID=283786 RepID=A0A1H4A8S8_BIZPA|nr:DUF4258 domain-containing protein [Bizionia paragorgiae]SEA32310.1 hypothetical protein SAMN04487990_11055 [Bizionia paragorgiae]
MSLLRRIAYYIGGFSLGLLLLAFFLNGKKVSCSYGPESRVLKNIRTKTLVLSDEAQLFAQQNSIDTIQINYILHKGDVHFSKSNTRKEPCGEYYIEGQINQKEAAITIENCEKEALLKRIEFIN